MEIFDKVVSNHFIPIIGDLLRIVCVVCNKFRPPLDTTHPDDKSIAEAMLELVVVHTLQVCCGKCI